LNSKATEGSKIYCAVEAVNVKRWFSAGLRGSRTRYDDYDSDANQANNRHTMVPAYYDLPAVDACSVIPITNGRRLPPPPPPPLLLLLLPLPRICFAELAQVQPPGRKALRCTCSRMREARHPSRRSPRWRDARNRLSATRRVHISILLVCVRSVLILAKCVHIERFFFQPLSGTLNTLIILTHSLLFSTYYVDCRKHLHRKGLQKIKIFAD